MKIVNQSVVETPFVMSHRDTNARYVTSVVLTQDELTGQFAVYRAISDLDDAVENRERIARQTAAHGEKLGYSRALAYFPDLKREDYRH